MASSSVLEEVKTAMTDYFALLSRMPHYLPHSLRLPPPEGWADMDVKGLKALGRSDAAIEFVRHLPCLEPCVNCENAWITASSPAVAFHRGETWNSYIGRGVGVSTPPHLFYLSAAVNARQGTQLLLDTERGTIVEVSMDGGPLASISWSEYDVLPDAEKWTAHRALSATNFFAQEAVRMQRLIYMPVPPSPGKSMSWPRFYHRAMNLWEEEQLLVVEDEWEADHEADSDYLDEEDDITEQSKAARFEDLGLESSEEDTSESEYEDIGLDEGELQGLNDDNEEYSRTNGPILGPGATKWKPIDLPKDTLHIYEIYKRNGWPYAGFDVDRCRVELLEVAAQCDRNESLKSGSSTKPAITREAWFEERRLLMKKKWKAEGQAWDEEKEKTQTAEEWWAEFQQENRKR